MTITFVKKNYSHSTAVQFQAQKNTIIEQINSEVSEDNFLLVLGCLENKTINYMHFIFL